MAPKKHNGFMMFVNNWRSLKAENRNCSISEAVSRCGTIWKNMTEQQRGPYNSAAKDADVSERCKRERLNCQGQSVSSVEREEREAANELQVMKRNIERSVMDGKKAHDLENTKFVFVAFNYFTKGANTQIYMPAEFAACEYSLKSGVNSIYSSMINPGTSIFGQGCDAMHHSTTTHQLPLPPNALGESDLGKLYTGIIEYLRKSQDDKQKPLVVYTPTDMMTMVKSCLRYLETGLDDNLSEQSIIVYDIQYLFYVLKKEAMDIAGIVDEKLNIFVTDAFFIKDFFEYQAGIACEFHEENDRGKYCTKSMVTRWGYTFSDYICGILAIKLIPGKHIPPTLKTSYHVKHPTQSESKDVTVSSFYSLDSHIKKETVSGSEASGSPPESRKSSFSAYVPGDHTAFAGNIRAQDDFPSLGGAASGSRKGKTKRNPVPPVENLNSHHHGSAVPEHMMAPWTLQRKTKAVDEDDFNVFANTSSASKNKKASARA